MPDPNQRPSSRVAEDPEALAVLANAMPQLVWTADAAGAVDYYNDRAVDYAGLGRDEDGHYRWQAVVHPEDLAGTSEAWSRAAATVEPYEFEHRIQMADGTYRWHLSRALPRRDASGTVRWYGTATDIHDLRSAREELRESEERLRLAAVAAGFGTYSHDLGSGTVFLSPLAREIMGVDPDLPQVSPIDVFSRRVHPDDRARMTRAAEAARAPGGSGIFRDVFRLEHPDGTTHWISATSLSVRDDGANPATGAAARRTIGVLVDVTAEHRSAEIRDTFLGILAHELRTPVTSILGAAELLERPQLDAEVRSSLTSDVASEARRLHRLVENLLILARAQRGAPIGGDEPVVLRSIVARAVAEQRRHRPGLTIEEWFEPGVPPASGDEPSVELIVRNLLSNAAKYGDPRAPIEVRVEAAPGADGGVVRLTVRDRGTGLSPETREHMFDLFYRSSEAQRVAGGAGIGLYVVRVLVEAMRGSVHADDHPDGGARFVVELPAMEDDAED